MGHWESREEKEKIIILTREKFNKNATHKTIWNGLNFKHVDLKAKLSLDILNNGHRLISIYTNGENEDNFYERDIGTQLQTLTGSCGYVIWEDWFKFDLGYIFNGWKYHYTTIENNDQYQEFVVRKYKIMEEPKCN